MEIRLVKPYQYSMAAAGAWRFRICRKVSMEMPRSSRTPALAEPEATGSSGGGRGGASALRRRCFSRQAKQVSCVSRAIFSRHIFLEQTVQELADHGGECAWLTRHSPFGPGQWFSQPAVVPQSNMLHE
jgi:hypothetical protein